MEWYDSFRLLTGNIALYGDCLYCLGQGGVRHAILRDESLRTSAWDARRIDCKMSQFFSLKSVKRGVRVLRARSTRASHAHRACEAREQKPVFLASLRSLALRFQPRTRPFV